MELVEEKQEICLPGGGKKPADYGDFAILLRTVTRTAPAFEKALEIQPNSVDTLESLKAICFRLRDEAGMMDKYNKYNEAWKAAKGQ